MMARRSKILVVAALVLGGFALKVPLALHHIHLTPDSIGYMNIAANLASGRGYISTIKLHYTDDAGVSHDALSDCPPLYPLFAAAVMRSGGGPAALILLNTLLICMASGLVFLIADRMFGWQVGVVAGIAAVLAPNLFHSGLTAMSDPLALVLILVSVYLVLRQAAGGWGWAVAGAVAGLAVVTRYPCILAGLILAAFAFAAKNGRRNGSAFSAGLLPAVAFAVVAAPPVQRLHYCVGSFQAAMRNSACQIDSLYCLHHPMFVARTIAHNLGLFSTDLLVGPRGLFLLGIGLVLWPYRAKASGLSREQRLSLLVATVNLAVYAATWSIPAVKGSRFLLLSYCLVLPFCAAGLVHAWGRSNQTARLAIVGACAATVAVYAWGWVTAAAFTDGDCVPLSSREVALVRAALPPDSALASNNPWVLSYSTGLPTAMLQRDLDAAALRRFVREYRICGIILVTPVPTTKTGRAIRACYPEVRRTSRVTIYRTKARTRTKAD